MPMPSLESNPGQWEEYVRRSYQSINRQTRRRAILRECDFRPDELAVAEFHARVRSYADGSNRLDEAAVSDTRPLILATYTTGGNRRGISEREFIRQFNDRIIRTLPQGRAGVVSALEDYVVEEIDYAAALAAGLDQGAKFIQDRLNFEYIQALELYEKEVLAPHIEISAAELEAYYSERGEHYSLPGDATGSLYLFASREAAAKGRGMLDRGATAAAAAEAQAVTLIVVKRKGPNLASDRPNALLLSVTDGRTVGPFDCSGQPALFLKHASGERAVPPLGEIQGVVRKDLLREKLDEHVLQLFRQRGDCCRLQAHIDLARYGIETTPLGDCRSALISAAALHEDLPKHFAWMPETSRFRNVRNHTKHQRYHEKPD